MNPEDFLDTAGYLLSANKREADRRSCISRAYYGVYSLLKEEMLKGIPLALLQSGSLGDRNRINHAGLASRLRISGSPDLQRLGERLDNLRSARIDADYKLDKIITQERAADEYKNATELRDDLKQYGVPQLVGILKKTLQSLRPS